MGLLATLGQKSEWVTAMRRSVASPLRGALPVSRPGRRLPPRRKPKAVHNARAIMRTMVLAAPPLHHDTTRPAEILGSQ